MHLKKSIAALTSVFRRPSNLFLASGVSFFMLGISVWYSNLSLIWWFFTETSASVLQKVLFLLSFFTSLSTNFTPVSAVSTVVASVLFGIVIAMLRQYISKRKIDSGGVQAGAWSLGGFVSAFFGIGCASCGSVIITTVLGVTTAGSVLSLLPLHGAEFSLLSILILLWTIHYLAKKLDDPLVCDV